MSRTVIPFLLIPLLFLPTAARCQLVEEYNPPKANCCLAGFAHSLADQLQDWNQLGRYHQDNERVKALPADPRRGGVPRRFHHRRLEARAIVS